MIESYTLTPEAGWSYLGDSVMGGVSTGAMRVSEERGRPVLGLSGQVSTENRGGFIQMRLSLPRPLPASAQGIALTARGNGASYFVHLRSSATRLPWQFFQAGFLPGRDWTDHRLTWDAFAPKGQIFGRKLRPETVTSIGIAAYGRDYTADLSLIALGVF